MSNLHDYADAQRLKQWIGPVEEFYAPKQLEQESEEFGRLLGVQREPCSGACLVFGLMSTAEIMVLRHRYDKLSLICSEKNKPADCYLQMFDRHLLLPVENKQDLYTWLACIRADLVFIALKAWLE